MLTRFIFSFFLLLSFSVSKVYSQSVVVGSVADEYLRFLQLSGKADTAFALINRPIITFGVLTDSVQPLVPLVRTRLHFNWGKKAYAGVLPLQLDQQLASKHPAFQNDGPMIPAKGYQVMLTGGVYAKAGSLHVQLMPEVVYAADRPAFMNRHFGYVPKGSYLKFFPGQSFVRVNAGPVAVSLSWENLWWGPGVYHSLLMSNQAPGFAHVKIHSHKPIKTPIGNFEFTLLGARLQSDSLRPYDNAFLSNENVGKPASRYLNAYILSYQPRFLKNLSVGVIRALQQYESGITAGGGSFFNKYLPVILKPVQKENAEGEDTKVVDQVASVFFRWLLAKSKAELYGEFGYNDYKKNIRDFVLNVPHTAAFLVGFKKVFPLGSNEALEAGVELTQLSESPDPLVRPASNWYGHGTIFEGYTHQNQVLGAVYITDAQTLSIAHQKELTRTTLTLQRLQRDPNRPNPDWTDHVFGIRHSRPYKGFYLLADLQLISSKNYAWEQGRNPFHVLARTGIRYYFHD